jgi:WD40 repeat protein
MSEPTGAVEPRGSPYFGLDYYKEKYGSWFFGRETEGGKIITNLRAARLTLLYAESGVGKSSLLRAGVAWRMQRLADHRLAQGSSARTVPVVFSSWKDDPVPQLVDAIGEAVRPYLAGCPEPDLPPDRLADAIKAAADAANANLYVMLDQFEEYFLYRGQEPTPARFADELATCVNRTDLRANFLISVREDAYAGLGDLFRGRIANIYGNYLHVEYLSRECAETAIRRPLDVYNRQPQISQPVEIQDALVEAVLDQVRAYDGSRDLNAIANGGRVLDLAAAAGTNGGEARVSTPLLQLVMDTIWQQELAGGSHVLRLSTLQNLRGVRMIVDTHLGKALDELGRGGRQTAIDLFGRLVTPSGGKIAQSVPDLAKRTGHSEDEVGNILTRLDDARIVRSIPAPPRQDPRRFHRYEIFHDVLAPAINHVIAARDEQRRTRRIQRFAALALALLLVTLAVVIVFAVLWRNSVNEKQIAVNEKQIAQSRELATDAEANTTQDPELAALLALQALRLHYTSQAEDALRGALPSLQEVRTFQTSTIVNEAAFDPVDMNKVASVDRSGVAWIWDVRTGRRLVKMSLGGFRVTGGALALAFNPAGTEVAVGYARGQVGIFDAHNGRRLRTASLTGSPTVNGVAFLGGTGRLATATQNGVGLWVPEKQSNCCHFLSHQEAFTVAAAPHNPAEFAVTTSSGVVIWNTSSGKPRHQRLPQEPWFANDAEFSPNGRQVVTAGNDGTVRVYDLRRHATVMTLTAGDVDAKEAAFSPNGSQIVAGYSNGIARVWDTSTRLQLTQLAGSAAPIDAARYSANGSEAVTASYDGTIRVWRARPRELQAEFASTSSSGQPNAVIKDAYLPDGRIITLNASGSVGVFTANGTQQAVIHPRGSSAVYAAWDRAGTELATGDADGSVDLWRAAGSNFTQVRLRSPVLVPGGIRLIAMSPDGSLITIVPNDDLYAIQVRSAYTGQLLRTLRAGASLSALAFSPVGSQLVASDYEGHVEVWSKATGSPQVLGKPGPGIGDLEFDKRGSEFVTASANGTVTVWAARGDLPRRPITACPSIATAALSPDGGEIVVGCADGTARVFDAATGRQLTVLPATTTGIVTAGFSPDSKWIVTAIAARGAGGVQVWNSELANPSPQAIERIAEQRVTRQLTPAERSTYLAGISG